MELSDCFLFKFWDGPGQYMFEVWSSVIVFSWGIGIDQGSIIFSWGTGMDQGNTCLKHGAQWLFSVQVLGWTRAINVWSMELCDCFLLRYRDRPGQYYFLLRYWDGPEQYMFEVWSSGIVFCSGIGRDQGNKCLKYGALWLFSLEVSG